MSQASNITCRHVNEEIPNPHKESWNCDATHITHKMMMYCDEIRGNHMRKSVYLARVTISK